MMFSHPLTGLSLFTSCVEMLLHMSFTGPATQLITVRKIGTNDYICKDDKPNPGAFSSTINYQRDLVGNKNSLLWLNLIKRPLLPPNILNLNLKHLSEAQISLLEKGPLFIIVPPNFKGTHTVIIKSCNYETSITEITQHLATATVHLGQWRLSLTRGFNT